MIKVLISAISKSSKRAKKIVKPPWMEKRECIKLMILANDKKCDWKTEKKWCNNFKDS